jgi:hypothetical protein
MAAFDPARRSSSRISSLRKLLPSGIVMLLVDSGLAWALGFAVGIALAAALQL